MQDRQTALLAAVEEQAAAQGASATAAMAGLRSDMKAKVRLGV